MYTRAVQLVIDRPCAVHEGLACSLQAPAQPAFPSVLLVRWWPGAPGSPSSPACALCPQSCTHMDEGAELLMLHLWHKKARMSMLHAMAEEGAASVACTAGKIVFPCSIHSRKEWGSLHTCRAERDSMLSGGDRVAAEKLNSCDVHEAIKLKGSDIYGRNCVWCDIGRIVVLRNYSFG